MNADAVPHSRTFDTPDELAQHVADWMVERAREQRRRFAVCLTGATDAVYWFTDRTAAAMPALARK